MVALERHQAHSDTDSALNRLSRCELNTVPLNDEMVRANVQKIEIGIRRYGIECFRCDRTRRTALLRLGSRLVNTNSSTLPPPSAPLVAPSAAKSGTAVAQNSSFAIAFRDRSRVLRCAGPQWHVGRRHCEGGEREDRHHSRTVLQQARAVQSVPRRRVSEELETFRGGLEGVLTSRELSPMEMLAETVRFLLSVRTVSRATGLAIRLVQSSAIADGRRAIVERASLCGGRRAVGASRGRTSTAEPAGITVRRTKHLDIGRSLCALASEREIEALLGMEVGRDCAETNASLSGTSSKPRRDCWAFAPPPDRRPRALAHS